MADHHDDSLEARLQQARAVVAALERGDEAEADRILDEEIGRLRESQMFQEICRLTRQLHDAMAGFMTDSKLSDLTENDIPDARERLRYVISMTEQAATTTLNAADEILPMAADLGTKTKTLSSQWDRFLQREMPYEEFKELSREITVFLQDLNQGMQQFQGQLNEVVMAQSFQDLTGQIIRRVIDLVQQIEGSLIQLIRFSALSEGAMQLQTATQQKSAPEKLAQESATDAQGPVVPGVDRTAVTSQDDVDDLLSSLGF
ncbi:MAG: protein phosphatase CheZ [Methylohalobius crimeensis]